MPINKRDDIRSVRPKTYAARDFDAFKAQLLAHAKQFFPDKINDFSDASLGGLFIDMAAFVLDTCSFYQDSQFNELDYATAMEPQNIERLLRRSGVKIMGASPAVVDVTAYVQVPAALVDGTYVPLQSSLPIVRIGSIFSSDGGTDFILLEDIDFTERDPTGQLTSDVRIGQRTTAGVPTTFVIARSGTCISGRQATETFAIGDTFVPFRRLTLANPHVSEIVSVIDDRGNTYYEVGALTHDVVYKNVLNTTSDNDLVPDAIKVVPAPYRFITEMSVSSRRTTLVFGGGNADTLEDDVIPDPSEFAVSFPYARTFTRIAVNPERLLETKTLGVAATSTTLSVTYRHGGGLSHNASSNSIRNVKTLLMTFPGNPSNSIAANVRGSMEVSNVVAASGGDDQPDLDDLKAMIPAARAAQERMVSKPDIVARVYSLPSNFGRVFRAAVRSNTNNPLATQLFVLSRSSDKSLITAPDTLKQNIVKYLNPYRMISDAIDVLDARIVNLQLFFELIVDPALNATLVMQAALLKLKDKLDIKNFHIDQPIVIAELQRAVQGIAGVISAGSMRFVNIVGNVNNRVYSDSTFDVVGGTRNGVLYPPPGAIFEVKFPENDIIGRIV